MNLEQQPNYLLSNEQQLCFDKYVQGKNIFITGPGGSGKSALIREIYLHATSRNKNIQVCALTGCAAVLLNVKAKTLHSWSGIGLGNGTIESIVLKIKKNKFSKEAWKKTQILVVDEVSMLSLKLFHMLNEVGKAIRGDFRPFGGIQLIFSGDFFQLPPVGNAEEPETQQFCFESDLWNMTFRPDCQISLVKIFRQSDNSYSQVLNQIREGKIKRSTNDLLQSYVGRTLETDLLFEPTKLFPTRNKVEQINATKMSDLPGEIVQFEIKMLNLEVNNRAERELRAMYTQKDMCTELEYISGNLLCEKVVQLKVGAQVMCIINIPSPDGQDGLEVCNGSQGVVVSFCEITGFPRVQFHNGKQMLMSRHVWCSEKIPGIGVSQIPLILAWAITIHKSQGASMDTAEIDIGSGIFECGQTYVALSRVRSLDGLYLTSFDVSRIKINRKVKDFYDALNNNTKN